MDTDLVISNMGKLSGLKDQTSMVYKVVKYAHVGDKAVNSLYISPIAIGDLALYYQLNHETFPETIKSSKIFTFSSKDKAIEYIEIRRMCRIDASDYIEYAVLEGIGSNPTPAYKIDCGKISAFASYSQAKEFWESDKNSGEIDFAPQGTVFVDSFVPTKEVYSTICFLEKMAYRFVYNISRVMFPKI